MTCPTREELVAVLDDEPVPGSPPPREAGPGRGLPPAPLAAARRHVEGCGPCRAELARLEAAVGALRAGSPAPEPSPWFSTRLAARIAALPPPRRRLALPAPWRLAGVVGLAAAVALGVVLVRQERGAEELAVAARLELLEDYEVVASLGDVEGADDVAVIAALDGLGEREGRP